MCIKITHALNLCRKNFQTMKLGCLLNNTTCMYKLPSSD